MSRVLLHKTLLCLGLGVFSSLLPFTSHAVEKIRLASSIWPGYAPLYVADKLDLYKAQGVKVELQFFSDPGLIVPALASKAVDGATLTYDQVIGAVAKGHKYKVVMPIDYSNGGDAVVAAKGITSIRELAGQKVGYAPLSPPEFLLSHALKSNGMSEKDIQSVNINPDAVPGAMASGSLAAGVTWEPNVSRIVAMGGGERYHVLYSSKDAPGLITDVLVFDEAQVTKRAKAIEALIKGYLAGLEYMHSHPQEAAAIVGEVLGVSTEEAAEQMQGVYNMPLAEMGLNFEESEATTSFYGSGKVIAELMLNSGQIPAVPDIGSTFDSRFIDALTQ
ncbi:ABC transporter substrate-binding protein [Pseudomonas sp. ABC1]|uniref:ABC transporter substrate-binding protein n=1 Tax=Pseudomonas sp. ABC1 TaxID=2748080 RepID=UPI00211A5D96|nr:ABC transporter substrate-binding protein [Pseudomonas sp. ABC1]